MAQWNTIETPRTAMVITIRDRPGGEVLGWKFECVTCQPVMTRRYLARNFPDSHAAAVATMNQHRCNAGARNGTH